MAEAKGGKCLLILADLKSEQAAFDAVDLTVKELVRLDILVNNAAQPYELAPAYVFLACSDSSNITGQVLHVNNGTVIN